MRFIVTIKGARLNAGYYAQTAMEAAEKAKNLLNQGEVTITDPHNEEWKPEAFQQMLTVWAKLSPPK